MGFLKSLGKAAGSLAGLAVGAPIALAGEIVKSDFLKEVGEGVYNASERTGTVLGSIAEGSAEAIYGTVTSDKSMQMQGLDKVVDSGTTYVSSTAKGIAHVTGKGFQTVGAILDGDTDTAMRTGKELAKVVAVSALTVGVLDVIDGFDGLDADWDADSLTADADEYIENPNIHHVTPHERLLPDGRTIWVDGDGNTNIHSYDGWYQHNPDYKA